MKTFLKMSWYALAVSCVLASVGCSRYRPHPMDTVPFMERAQTQERGGLRVTASVMGPEESRRAFGVNLPKKGIQPVWIEIDNQTDRYFGLLMSGVDPNYYSAREAAYKSHFFLRPRTNKKIDRHFAEHGIPGDIFPGEKRSGFVFSNLRLGAKEVRVRLWGPKTVEDFIFYIPVPSGHKFDFRQVDWENLYGKDEMKEFETEEELREAIAGLGCCTTRKHGTGKGDPLNLIILTEGDDLVKAFIRAGWDFTEVLTAGSAWRTFKAFFGGEYKTSPMSALYVWGRPQDVGLQKARDTIHERNHLRLWLSPWIFKGKDVWVGTITRDIGVYFTTRAWNLTTHAIDPDVDEARGYLTEDLAFAQDIKRFGFARGVGAATEEDPHRNLMNAPWWTDGLRVVLELPRDPVPMDQIEFFYWDWSNDDDEGDARLNRALRAHMEGTSLATPVSPGAH